jgi:uncharacterized protein
VNPRSPFVLDTREVGRRPGSRRDYRREAPAPAHFGLDMIGVPEGSTLIMQLRLESVSEGVLVTGSVSGTVAGECGRCLSAFTEPLAVDFMELFAYPNSSTDETTDPDEIPRLEGDHLDVEPVIRDAVVLSLPLTPLCRPDCAGLCPECGELLDELPADHTHVQLDPRWAALADRLAGSTTEEQANPARSANHPQSQE